MSILIKGVTLDDFKPICPCMNGDDGCCDVPGIKRCYGIGKDGCPLVEIPPHGRLGDLDRMLADNEIYYNQLGSPDGEIGARYRSVKKSIELAPTIIPADPAEEGET